MASIPQTWAKDAESGGADQGHYTPTAGDARPYADTDRFGSTQKGETQNITLPLNLVSDPVWGVNNYAGGINTPEAPQIPVTLGE